MACWDWKGKIWVLLYIFIEFNLVYLNDSILLQKRERGEANQVTQS